jgi:hypothetical protein
MKTLSNLVACLAATVAIATFAQADEERHIKLIINPSPETGLVTIEGSELAIGETRSFTSEKGLPVQVTRTEKGFEIEADGKKTQIDLPGEDGDGFDFETFHDEGKPGEPVKERVIVKRLGKDGKIVTQSGDGSKIIIHSGDPASGAPHKVEKEVRVIRVHGGEGADGKKVHLMIDGDHEFAAARAKLIASGALDGLDEATRERILAALGGE